MKMITMWKDYYREVIIPSLNWINRYWKECFLLSFIIGCGVGYILPNTLLQKFIIIKKNPKTK